MSPRADGDTPFVSYAQHGEDVILWRALGDRADVFYVDAGAYHPTQESVTRALYERGWRGMNIEAQPDRLQAFLDERPDDINLSLALGERDGFTTLLIPETPGWASTLDPAVTGADPASRTVEVPVRRLVTVLAEYGVEHVDVLKIDVEGAEPQVVRGMLAGPVRPVVCVVEGVAPGIGRTAGDEAVRLLEEEGYIHCLFDGLNHYLTTDPALQPALALPANPIDGYITDRLERLLTEREQLIATISALAGTMSTVAAGSLSRRPAESSGGFGTAPEPGVDIAGSEAPDSDRPFPLPGPGHAPELPLPADAERVTPSSTSAGVVPAPVILDPQVRATRRRLTFTRRLRHRGLTSRHQGGTGRVDLLALVASERPAAETVKTLYRLILGREADSDGLVVWQERLTGGMSARVMAHSIAESAEAGLRPAEWRARIQRDLRVWDAFESARALGVAPWRPEDLGDVGRIADRVLVRAIFEVALLRPPTAPEEAHELGRLAGGAGRDEVIRAFALRPDVFARIVGTTQGGLGARVRRRMRREFLLADFRERVLAAENRQVAGLLAPLQDVDPEFLAGLRRPIIPGGH